MFELIYIILNIIVLLILTVVMYFLPTIIAIVHKHKNILPIVMLNVLLGWTLIGWVIAFIWSITNEE